DGRVDPDGPGQTDGDVRRFGPRLRARPGRAALGQPDEVAPRPGVRPPRGFRARGGAPLARAPAEAAGLRKRCGRFVREWLAQTQKGPHLLTLVCQKMGPPFPGRPNSPSNRPGPRLTGRRVDGDVVHHLIREPEAGRILLFDSPPGGLA